MDKKLLDTAKQQGKMQERYRIAQNLLYEGFDVDTVYLFTNLSRKKICIIYDYLQSRRNIKFSLTDEFVKPDNRNVILD